MYYDAQGTLVGGGEGSAVGTTLRCTFRMAYDVAKLRQTMQLATMPQSMSAVIPSPQSPLLAASSPVTPLGPAGTAPIAMLIAHFAAFALNSN